MPADINSNLPVSAPLQQLASRRRGMERMPAAANTSQAQPRPEQTNQSAAERVQSDPVASVQLQLDDAVKGLEQFIQNNRRELRFSVDDDLGRTVVTILDSNDEVIRKIPSEEVLAIARRIKEASSDAEVNLFSAKI